MSIFNTNALISKILIVLMLSSVSLSVSSKVGKYKYSKYIRYEGELDSNHCPNGKGTLFICDRKKTATLEINGTFNAQTAKDISFSNSHFHNRIDDLCSYTAGSLDYSISSKGDNVSLVFHTVGISDNNGLQISQIDVLEFVGELSESGEIKPRVTLRGNGILQDHWIGLPSIIDYPVKSEEVYVQVSNYFDILGIVPKRIIYSNGKIFKYDDHECSSLHSSSSVIRYSGENFNIVGYTLTLNGGVVEYNDKSRTATKITYTNGDVFSSDSLDPFEYTGNLDLVDCKEVSQFRILNGKLSHHQIIDTYRDGEVVSTYYPLSGGSYTKEKSGLDVLKFNDGSMFIASTPNGIIPRKEYSRQNTTSDFTMVNGSYIKNGVEMYSYEDGKMFVKNIKGINAFPTHHVSRYDINCSELSYREYDGSVVEGDPKDLKHIINDDVVEYFHKSDIKTELQKKAFAQTPEYEQLYNKLQITKNHLYEDEYVVEMSAHDLKYDVNLGCFQLDELRYATDNHLVEGNSDYHLIFRDYYKLCLTYPRSLVDKKTIKNFWGGDDHHWVTAWTGKVSESDALKFENNKESCKLYWYFKFEGVNKYLYIYGKTTRIYLVNKETGEIYCDLSNSLKASNSKFKSLNVSRDSLPKKTYHSKGEVENCGLCFGTGKGWSAGTHCPQCGGKGWYIEHYW